MANPITGNPESELKVPASWVSYLSSSAYTAADVLAKVESLDGPGSLLDADLLDGRHLSELSTVSSEGLVAYWNMDSVPEIPTATGADLTYLQDAWADVDGWAGSNCSVANSSGTLVITQTVAGTRFAVKNIAAPSGIYTLRIRVKINTGSLTTSKLFLSAGEFTYSPTLVFSSLGEYKIFDVAITAGVAVTAIGFLTDAGNINDSATIDWLYIGTGAYLPNSIVDNSGNGNHGTIYGATPVAGISGKALSFDGVNDYVSFPIIKMIDEMTYRVLCKSNGLTVDGAIVVHGAPSVSGFYSRQTTTSGQICMVFARAGGNDTILVNNVFVNTTEYVDLVFIIKNSNKSYQVYRNGTLFASGNTTNTWLLQDQVYQLGKLIVGTNLFSGTIDEPRIYNRALSAEEVYSLYHNKAGGPDCQVKSVTPVANSLMVRDASGITGVNGIKFPGTQSESADVNTLDDYEEGTWAPTYTPTTGAFGTVTYSAARFGKYQKVGNTVHAMALLRTDSVDIGTGSGNLRVAGLPFVTNAQYSVNVPYSLNFAGENPSGGITGSSDFVLTYKSTADDPSAINQVSDLTTGASVNANFINIHITYQVA